MKMRTHQRGGFTLIEILIVVLIVGIVLVIAIPNFLKVRQRSQHQLCIENLAQIESAKQLLGLEQNKTNGDDVDPDDLYGETKYIKVKPTCPSTGADYTINPIGTIPSCATEGHTL